MVPGTSSSPVRMRRECRGRVPLRGLCFMEERPGDMAKLVKLLWRGSVWELQLPSVCTMFVAIAPFAALSWAWRWSGRLLGSQGSGGRVRFCTPCGASGDAAGRCAESAGSACKGRHHTCPPCPRRIKLPRWCPGARRSLATRMTPASWFSRGRSD